MTTHRSAKCGRVEPWVYGHIMVKFDTEKHPLPCPLLCYMPCSQDATWTARSPEGFVFHWCDKHAAEPICGAVVDGEVP